MDVTELAERIVFGNSLEDKLTCPSSLTFERESEGLARQIDRVQAPGRPAGMSMHEGPGAAQPPSIHDLESERERGRLLHFLANHELLATELMALVLLKFPDAPLAFRRGVLRTLQEEQEHTRLYLAHMKACGIEFGSVPLSGHFWRVVEPMDSPMDFVSRLSLTFEQANLDYSLHFASVFNELGDTDTARILQRIYQDEIGHVKHGLHWFRKWKDPQLSDWQAYQQALEFPMSPQRGRGPICAFNRDGRKLAGLTDEFIDSMEVYRQSRGRPPKVRWFDPGAEAELAGNVSPSERALLQQLAIDLEGVMIALSQQDDVQLVRRIPSVAFRKSIIHAGLDLPECIVLDNAGLLAERKLHSLAPWAWTPQSHRIAADLKDATQHRPADWKPEFEDLFRKSWLATRLTDRLSQSDTPNWMAAGTSTGVHSTDEVELSLKEFAGAGYKEVIFKSDLATAGRQQRRLSCNGLATRDTEWLASIWKQGAQGVVEPELNRLIDMSFLWDLSPGDSPPQSLGWTRALVTSGRRYAGTRLSRPFEDCNPELRRFLLEDECGRLNATQDWLHAWLVPQLAALGFAHCFGIDAFVHRDVSGDLKIHPAVELNPRVTMGHVALALRKRIAPVTYAEFRVFTRPEWDEFEKQESATPLQLSKDGRWLSGVVTLTDVDARTKLVPAVVIRQPPARS